MSRSESEDAELDEDLSPAHSPTTSNEPEPAASGHQTILTPKLSARWALKAVHMPLFALYGTLFMVINYLPLQSSELWAHVSYGQWIFNHRALPTQDPLMPLAEGMPISKTAWLSQLTFAEILRLGGAQWLSHTFALTVLVAFLFLGRAFYLQSRQVAATVVGLLAVLLVSWSRLATFQPEICGFLCFACLLWLIADRAFAAQPEPDHNRTSLGAGSWTVWIGTPLLFSLWVNLDGSFVWGLVVLGCLLLGRMVEVCWRTHSLRLVVADRSVRHWFYLFELALVATLINPLGMDLLLEKIWFPVGLENLRDTLDWQPLVISSRVGLGFAISWVVLLVVMRHSRRPVPFAQVLLLAALAAAAVYQTRMLTWYGPVFAFVLAPHLAELMPRFLADSAGAPREPSAQDAVMLPVGRVWLCTLVCLLLAWMAFTLSPISSQLLGSKSRTPRQLFGEATPLALTEFLRENPPQGQVFHPHWWGDWLVWDGPPGLQLFTTSRVQAVPRQVWQDYGRAAYAQAGWDEVMDRYAVTTLIVDQERQPTLTELARRSPDWTLQYEDEQAVLFHRESQRETATAEIDDTRLQLPGTEIDNT